MCTHTTAHVWRTEDNLQGSILPIHLVASGNQPQVLELGANVSMALKIKLFKVYRRRAG